MEDLHDDVLVHLFSFLDTEMLVRELRAVCTRWRSLALHPDAWRHRSVSCCALFVHDFLLKRVLALAPCLNEFEMELFILSDESRDVEQERELMELAAATSCAVRCLRVEGRCPFQLDLASCLLRRQVALGRLRRLSLIVPSGGSQLRGMLEAVADLDLEALDLDNDWEPAIQEALPAVTAGSWGKGSLKELRLSNVHLDPVFEFVVRHRSGSLQSVHFRGFTDLGVPTTPWMAALAGCSKLEIATVPAVMDVSSLSACPSLTHLVITARIPSTAATAEALAQFSTALALSLAGLTQLRVLEIGSECDDVCVSGADVLCALARSGASRVEELKLSLSPIREALSLRELLLALTEVPRLHTLRLYSPPSAEYLIYFLSFAAPRLTLLELTERSDSVRMRLIRAVREAVQENPQFHVVLNYSEGRWYDISPRPQGWYGHGPEVDCRYLHDSAVEWQWLPGVPK